MAKGKDKDIEEESPLEEDAPPEEDEFLDEQAAAAEAQSPAEPQTVPEQRPQSFISPTGGDSEAGKRAAKKGAAMGKEAYDRAQSQDAKDEAEKEGRLPRLYPGQRVQIIEPNAEAGRMAFVQAPQFPTAVDQLVANSGTPEAQFAPVTSYVVQTRDGRSDVFDVPAEELKVLEPNQGWGRGQI